MLKPTVLQFRHNNSDNFCCSECGAKFDLSTNYGRKAAKYGLCRKCGIELILRSYKASNCIAKIIFFIPYLIIKRMTMPTQSVAEKMNKNS